MADLCWRESVERECGRVRINELKSQAEDSYLVATIFFISGSVLAGGGALVLLLTDFTEPGAEQKEHDEVKVQPMVGPGAFGIRLELVF